MEGKTAKEEKVEQVMSSRRSKVESLRGRLLRRAEGMLKKGEEIGGLGLLSGAGSQTEQTGEGTTG